MYNKIIIDKKHTVILLYNKTKNEFSEKTQSILSIYKSYYYKRFTGYNIYFKGSKTKYFYDNDSVIFIHKIKNINIDNLNVYIEGIMVDAIKLEQFNLGFYKVYLSNQKDYIFTNKLKIKEDKHKNLYDYYFKLSEYGMLMAEENSPLFFLCQNYQRIRPSESAILFDYLNGRNKSIKDNELMLVPFAFNQSQLKSIEQALTNKISVIEGPPGTGKTQTILNLICNIIFRDNNVAVVSNNNTAIENIFEKLTEEKYSFIAASLGRSKNVEEFFENNTNDELVEFLQKDIETIDNSDKIEYEKLTKDIKTIQKIENEVSILESKLNEMQTEKRHYDITVNNNIFIRKDLQSHDYMKLILRLEKPKKIGFIERWLLNIKYKVKIKRHDTSVILENAELLYYESIILEIKNKIKEYEIILNTGKKESVSKNLRLLSLKFLNNKIIKNYETNGINDFTKNTYKNNFDNFLKMYPVVLSTSHSLLNNAPKGFAFDYLIIDEASQGDLLSSVLAMSCARNLVVVGDSNQLQQIEDERLFEKSEILTRELNVSNFYRYESNSILRSIKNVIKDVPTTLLREHYRCAPDIINFCNKMFYDGELIIKTKNNDNHIQIIKTVPGNHARKNPNGSGLYNQREIDEIKNLITNSNSNNIGIITPFRYQANLLSKIYNIERVEADTIHKFQGRQKDEVILSLVANSLSKNPQNIENKLYDFLTNEKLLNVAISRGKSKVTMVVSDKIYHSTNNIINSFIKYAEYLYGKEITEESNITSVFDNLYSEYTEIIISRYKNKPDNYKSELLMIDLINEVIKDYKYINYSVHTRLGKIVNTNNDFTKEEKKYIMHPWTHVDFLFYNKVSKEKLFVLEVDGISYHEQNQKQRLKDNIKDRVLLYNNIDIYRFKTNESNEKQRLTNIIEQYIY